METKRYGSRRTLRDLADPMRALLVGFAAIALFAVLGLASALDASFLGGGFRLNGEWTVAAFASATPLLLGAWAGVLIGSRALDDRLRWFGFAAVLGYMAFDEVLAVHERLETVIGLDWQLLYLPIGAVAALSWALVRARLGPIGRQLLLAGSAAWVASQVLELLQWQGDVKDASYLALMVPEELLEMTGSLLFLVALLTRVDRSTSRANEPNPTAQAVG